MNYKTEYSRCRLPRLVIDNEEWRKAKKEEKKELEKEKDDTDADEDTMHPRGLEKENDVNRMETKRKKEIGKAGNGQAKRKKLDPLIDWGEAQIEFGGQ